MKTLLLVRHAKSNWDDPSLPDHDRPLADRGKRDVVTMGQRLAQRRILPDLVLTSSAARATATAQALAQQLGYPRKAIVVDESLYACRADDLLAAIQAVGKKPDCVMVVGHNPEMTELAHRLSGDIVELPTCAVAEFTFDVGSWANIGGVAPLRARLDTPKNPL